ncbi:MAG: mannonate dehydratase [Silicimonas sp.]|jgi:mannonate dehydratase|nr:mannonate dehydratase [Silicimonas sp.]
MKEGWRWYGPDDPVPLAHIRQAGATDIVTALHGIYDGRVWPLEDIRARQAEVSAAGLVWSVVESIPVPQSIKTGGAGAAEATGRFIDSMRNVAEAGIEVICYNFMPVVDWTRTDLRYRAPNGGLALRFDPVAFAAYDLFVLKRPGAESDYSAEVAAAAEKALAGMSETEVGTLEHTIISGLPGAEGHHTRSGIAALIADYDGMTDADLRANLIAFQSKVVPVAEELGLRLGIHPDDPPFSLFGLPRVVSQMSDYEALFAATPSLANGVTFCTGSLGGRADNDLPAMLDALAPRVHFAHLRNVLLEPDGSFFEADHLDGSTDMVAIVDGLLREERRRKAEGRKDAEIPMRPDHGHLLLDDIEKETLPGYSAIGRLKGLAELRGVMRALNRMEEQVG